MTKRLTQLGELTTITDIGVTLLLESHNFEGYSEFTRKGDIYAVNMRAGEDGGGIEFAVVENVSPFTLKGVTGSTTNLMSKIAAGGVEVLGRLIDVQQSLIFDVSSLRERQMNNIEDCEACEHSSEGEEEFIN